MNAHSTPMLTDAIVLRVVEGRQVGVEYRLAQGISVTVGHGFQHDVVLRLPSAKDFSIQMDVKSAVVSLKMQGGSASLLGRPLVMGDMAQLPFYVPLVIGDTSFAIGNPDSDRWSEVSELGQSVVQTDALEASAISAVEEQAPASSEAIVSGMAQQAHGVLQVARQVLAPVNKTLKVEQRWPIYAMIAATLLIAALLFNPISSWFNHQYNGVSATQEMLRDAGFKDVMVQQSADGNLLIKGLVRNDADLTRLRRLISEKQSRVTLDVTTLDGLASSVTDMLVAQGLDAEARAGRGKTLIVDSEYLPGDRQAELAAQIQKDMPALKQVVFQVNPKRGEPMLQYFFASKDYGIASFVDGDPAYISTANGDKWFKGATVPTGHVIIEIGNGRVRFEREGNVEELTIASDVSADGDVMAEAGAEVQVENKAE
jgi:type III secretion protein D